MCKDLKQFDIVFVDFGNDTIGSEQGGKRPCLVIQNDIGNQFAPTTIVIPLTSEKKNLNQPTHAVIHKGKAKGLIKDSMLLGECIRQISEKRIIKKLGSLTDFADREKVKQVYMANLG